MKGRDGSDYAASRSDNHLHGRRPAGLHRRAGCACGRALYPDAEGRSPSGRADGGADAALLSASALAFHARREARGARSHLRRRVGARGRQSGMARHRAGALHAVVRAGFQRNRRGAGARGAQNRGLRREDAARRDVLLAVRRVRRDAVDGRAQRRPRRSSGRTHASCGGNPLPHL